MRASLWAVLVGLCLAVGLFCVERGESQTAATTPTGLFPIGRPYTFASGFTGPVQNVPIDTTSSLVVLPQQSVGMIMPNFRKLMLFPNHNVVNGVSPIPAPNTFPGASFFNNLNPFKTPTK